MSASKLIGPPEIHHPRPPLAVATTTIGGGEASNTTTSPPMGFTENKSLTYLSSGNPCLDFFFHIVPKTPSEDLTERLLLSWKHNPLTTLKLICNLRGVRGTGKSDKENFYSAALWLHKHHPKTLACNLDIFADFGYFKDLPEILFRIFESPDVRTIAKSEWDSKKKGKGGSRGLCFLGKKRVHGAKSRKGHKKKVEKKRSLRARIPRDQRVEANMEKVKEEREKARDLREKTEVAQAEKAFERYSRDTDYRFLHDQISNLFAERLKSGIQYLNPGETKKISLAAKWCPTIESSYDKSILICENIARRLFSREDYIEYQEIEEAHYAYRVRDRLRKEVLVPLHKVLELPEVHMSAKLWETIPYNRVASVAMKNYKEIFLRHDNQRFKEYLDNVKCGKATIAAGALLPHEIIASSKDGDGGQVAELQWARMVDDLKKKGTLRNCIAVCDVSGNMSGTPMEVFVALGLLISELSEEPWKGKVITFR
ncbi:unnamed protein product [Ilex paraguariensis]|uniref:Uncharacterized protein n=1 Tax=Ilex paraguariensis TaxID=185542 RepID=A0ABC8SZA2_9AQUA